MALAMPLSTPDSRVCVCVCCVDTCVSVCVVTKVCVQSCGSGKGVECVYCWGCLWQKQRPQPLQVYCAVSSGSSSRARYIQLQHRQGLCLAGISSFLAACVGLVRDPPAVLWLPVRAFQVHTHTIHTGGPAAAAVARPPAIIAVPHWLVL